MGRELRFFQMLSFGIFIFSTLSATAATFKKEGVKFSFNYSDDFLLGHHAHRSKNADQHLPPDIKEKFEKDDKDRVEVVLIERTIFSDTKVKKPILNLESLPEGEYPTIIVTYEKGHMAQFMLTRASKLFDPKKKPIIDMKIGPHKVQKWPGYPGPYGDSAYYYVVPIASDEIISFMAAKQTLHNSKLYPPTQYDRVIESIIASLTIK
jgi:hypothetical protein